MNTGRGISAVGQRASTVIKERAQLATQGQGLTQEQATQRRQTRALDEEIAEAEQRFKALARGRLGASSLLGGAARTSLQRATGSVRRTSSRATPSLLGTGVSRLSRDRSDRSRNLD